MIRKTVTRKTVEVKGSDPLTPFVFDEVVETKVRLFSVLLYAKVEKYACDEKQVEVKQMGFKK